ncbi:hypothetical protein QQF64_020060 [Cirrhinus molitorella]|uniref:Uncharacterized protein n=1 Tax=Cirrhinus molitorella TaxID=172907 RepID=A0ABR3LKI8_9TELE
MFFLCFRRDPLFVSGPQLLLDDYRSWIRSPVFAIRSNGTTGVSPTLGFPYITATTGISPTLGFLYITAVPGPVGPLVQVTCFSPGLLDSFSPFSG